MAIYRFHTALGNIFQYYFSSSQKDDTGIMKSIYFTINIILEFFFTYPSVIDIYFTDI